MQFRLISIVILGLTLSAGAIADEALQQAANGAHRSAENIARNAWRHPVETLSFFGIEPGMTVVEIWPGGGGWYTEVLAPYLRKDGKLYAANYDGSTGVEYFARNAVKFKEKLAANPAVYDRVEITTLMPPAATEAAPAGSADLVVTFRNLHNFVRDGRDEAMFAAMYATLKPGGILGLVAHRGDADMLGPVAAKKGYLAESEAIRVASAAGFEFVEKSDINANPKDDHDHPNGVWTLPPRLRVGDANPAEFVAIGESDRMTMKFRKPLQ